MENRSLNGSWNMICGDGHAVTGQIPGSVYSFLLNAGEMEDPYYRDNERRALSLMEEDYTFVRTFDLPDDIEGCAHQVLRFDGIDTLSDVYLNGVKLGSTDNMHLAWEYPVRELLKEKANVLTVTTHSPCDLSGRRMQNTISEDPMRQCEVSRISGKHTACSGGTGVHAFPTRASGRTFSFSAGMMCAFLISV